MRRLVVFTAISLCFSLVAAQSTRQVTDKARSQNPQAMSQNPAAKAAPFPLQLEIRVPFDPTAFPGGGHSYLAYELYLTNFSPSPLSLSGIAVLNADAKAAQPLAAFGPQQLRTMVQPLGSASPNPDGRLVIAGGQCSIAFIWLEFDRGEMIPNTLIHRVETSGGAEEGAAIVTHQTQLRVLGPPVEGDWLADDGPSNEEDNHHRRGVFVLNGRALDDRRFAIDWKQVKNGASYSGDARDVHSYYSYGRPVFAVADGPVVAARDGLPDNIPGHGQEFHSAVPITLDTIAGNTITLDLGGGQFAYYMHLQPGSVQVHMGDRVRRGQVMARVGATGDAREPHLHFEVTNSPELALGEGVPYLIDRYCTKNANGAIELHTHELPLDHDVVGFGEGCGQ
jgi:hypothetical protein